MQTSEVCADVTFLAAVASVPKITSVASDVSITLPSLCSARKSPGPNVTPTLDVDVDERGRARKFR